MALGIIWYINRSTQNVLDTVDGGVVGAGTLITPDDAKHAPMTQNTHGMQGCAGA